MPEKAATTSLRFSRHSPAATIRESILPHAESLTDLTILNRDFFLEDHLTDLDLPELTDFTIAGFDCLKTQQSWDALKRLNLKRLCVGASDASDFVMEQLANAPWWQKLTQFEVQFLRLDKVTNWRSLWEHREFSFQTLSLFYVEDKHLVDLFNSKFPDLSYLIFGTETKSAIEVLDKVYLPKLSDLELGYANVPKEAVKWFINKQHESLPELRRIGLSYRSDRRKDIHDWNGAIVDWDLEPMTEAELREYFFNETKLQLLPRNTSLNDRIRSRDQHIQLLNRV